MPARISSSVSSSNTCVRSTGETSAAKVECRGVNFSMTCPPVARMVAALVLRDGRRRRRRAEGHGQRVVAAVGVLDAAAGVDGHLDGALAVHLEALCLHDEGRASTQGRDADDLLTTQSEVAHVDENRLAVSVAGAAVAYDDGDAAV